MPRYCGQDARAPSVSMQGGKPKGHGVCARSGISLRVALRRVRVFASFPRCLLTASHVLKLRVRSHEDDRDIAGRAIALLADY